MADKTTMLSTKQVKINDGQDLSDVISEEGVVTERTADIDFWDSAVDYNTSEMLVIGADGIHYTSTGLTGNLDKDPVNPINSDYWYPSFGIKALIRKAKFGEICRGGMHKVNNIQDADYQTSLLLDKASFGGTEYEFYLVHLDGSVVSGDATLEAIFDLGGSAEYPFLEKYAPDVLGSHTLLDAQGRTFRSMTGAGGEAETLGEAQLDQMQQITGEVGWVFMGIDNAVSLPDRNDSIGSLKLIESTVLTYLGIQSSGNGGTMNLAVSFNSADSPDARTSSTTDGETRMANIVEGLGFIIVMKAV
jgi:hypothetical protein